VAAYMANKVAYIVVIEQCRYFFHIELPSVVFRTAPETFWEIFGKCCYWR